MKVFCLVYWWFSDYYGVCWKVKCMKWRLGEIVRVIKRIFVYVVV